jgi:hypothetical protein
MEFTCIKCEFKFHKMSYDLDERMCFECLYAEDNNIIVKDILNTSVKTHKKTQKEEKE